MPTFNKFTVGKPFPILSGDCGPTCQQNTLCFKLKSCYF